MASNIIIEETKVSTDSVVEIDELPSLHNIDKLEAKTTHDGRVSPPGNPSSDGPPQLPGMAPKGLKWVPKSLKSKPKKEISAKASKTSDAGKLETLAGGIPAKGAPLESNPNPTDRNSENSEDEEDNRTKEFRDSKHKMSSDEHLSKINLFYKKQFCYFKPTAAQESAIRAVAPDLSVEFKTDGTHPHPILAYERRIAEEWMLKQLRNTIIWDYETDPFVWGRGCHRLDAFICDVGGSIARHERRGIPGVWCCAPILSQSDQARWVKLKTDPGPTVCKCIVQECQCVPFASFMFGHSLYYFHPRDVLYLLMRSRYKVAYASVHQFPDAVGSFYDEAQYKVDVDGGVEMRVRGNETSYSHNAIHWLKRGQYSDGRNTLAWCPAKVFGHTTVFRFYLGLDNLPATQFVDRLFFDDALKDKDYYGGSSSFNLTGKEAKEVRIDALMVGSYRTYHTGNTLLLSRDGKERILLPKSLIQDLINLAIYRTRDDATFRILVQHAKRHIGSYRIPAEYATNALLYAPVIAFAHTVRLEGTLLAACVEPHIDEFNTHSNALQIKKRLFPWWHWRGLYQRVPWTVKMVTLVGGGLFLWSKLPDNTPKGVQAGFVGTMAVAAFGLSRQRPLPTRVPALDHFIETGACPVPIIKEVYEIKRDLPAITSGLDENTPLHASARIYQGILEAECDRSNPEAVKHVGPADLSNLVSAFASNRTNEVISLKYRALRPGLEIRIDKFKQFRAWIFTHINDLFPHPNRFSDDSSVRAASNRHNEGMDPVRAWTFEFWNSRFPRRRALEHERAHRMLQAVPFKALVVNQIRKTFVKVEKKTSGFGGEYEDSAPRTIQGQQHEANVIIAPWVQAFAEALKKSWCKKHLMTFASGMNALQIGEWWEECGGHNHPSQIYIEDDFSKMDAHFRPEMCLLEFDIYRHFGCPDEVYALMCAGIHTVGYTRTGVKYSIEGTRKSGDSFTSVGNTILNGLMHLYAFCITNNCTPDDLVNCDLEIDRFYSSIVVGDDGVFRHSAAKQVAPYGQILGELGFKVKPVVLQSSYRTQFCSGRFWPSDKGVIHGPKPGRIIAKLGFTLSPQHKDPNYFKSVLHCLRRDVAHIPILNDYIETLYKKLPGKTVHVQDSDFYHKFHSPIMARPVDESLSMVDELYGWGLTELRDWKRFVSQKLSGRASFFSYPPLNEVHLADS
jgi:hypothetical protein